MLALVGAVSKAMTVAKTVKTVKTATSSKDNKKAKKFVKGGEEKSKGGALVKTSESGLAVRPTATLAPKMPMRKMISSDNLKQTSKSTEGGNILDTLRKILNSLIKSTDALSQVVQNQLANTLKKNDSKKKLLQNKKRKKKEEESEVKQERVKKDFGLPKPEIPFGKQIMNFIKGFVFGTAIMELIRWLSDPEKKKSLFKFLGDNIGNIFLAAIGLTALMVAAPFLPALGMMMSMLSVMGSIIAIMAPFALPAIAAGALFTAPAWLPKLFPGLVNQQANKIAAAPGTNQQKIKQLQAQYNSLNWFQKYVQGMGPEIQKQIKILQQKIKQEQQQQGSQPKPTTRPQPPAPISNPDIVKVSHPETGSGFGIKGVNDSYGRPAVFSSYAAEAFARMLVDSGGVVKGSDIASSGRSRAKNASLSGSDPNSHHLYGEAMDIHGDSKQWIIDNGAKYGWQWSGDYGGSHTGHFYYDGPGSGSTPILAPHDPSLDPSAVSKHTSYGNGEPIAFFVMPPSSNNLNASASGGDGGGIIINQSGSNVLNRYNTALTMGQLYRNA